MFSPLPSIPSRRGRGKITFYEIIMDELKGFLFPEDESSEKTFRAIPLNYQYLKT